VSDSYTQVAPDSTGDKIDTEELTVNSQTVQRQRVELAGAAAAEILKIRNSRPISTDYAAIVRPMPTSVTLASSNTTPITASGDTTAISAPSAGNHIRVYAVHTSNDSATATITGWKDGTGTPKRYPAMLPQYGQHAHNVKGGDGYWALTTATALVLHCSAAASVHYTVEYEVVPD
jgi:hypothetical protein